MISGSLNNFKESDMEEIKTELFIPGTLQNELIINDMIKHFKVEIKILEASFSSQSGWALLTIKGAKDEINRVFAFLMEKGVTVQTKEDNIT